MATRSWAEFDWDRYRAGFARAPHPEPLGSRASPRRPDSDQADRDAIASRLLRFRDERGTAWADLVGLALA
jgi:hypothetical protein